MRLSKLEFYLIHNRLPEFIKERSLLYSDISYYEPVLTSDYGRTKFTQIQGPNGDWVFVGLPYDHRGHILGLKSGVERYEDNPYSTQFYKEYDLNVGRR